MFHLIGEGFYLLRRLARDLSSPALTSGGLSPETVEFRLEGACVKYLEDTFLHVTEADYSERPFFNVDKTP